MPKQDQSLLDEIESASLDGSVPLADALRMCVVLGGRAGSAELRAWAERELQGYANDRELPDYRVIHAVLRLDGMTSGGFGSFFKITGQQLSATDLPDVAQEKGIGNEVRLTHGVGELEAMANQARSRDGVINLSLPNGDLLVKLMNYEMQSSGHAGGQHVEMVYWAVGETSLRGVLDQIRTTLARLVAEMRTTMPTGADEPSKAVADNAVHVVVEGKKSTVTVQNVQMIGDGNQIAAPMVSPGRPTPWWRSVGAMIVGAATVVAAVVGLFAWQGWFTHL